MRKISAKTKMVISWKQLEFSSTVTPGDTAIKIATETTTTPTTTSTPTTTPTTTSTATTATSNGACLQLVPCRLKTALGKKVASRSKS